MSPPVLPVLMTSMAERVVAAVKGLEPHRRPAPADRAQALSGIDRPAAISIFGEPGSGKSTVLHRVRDLLLCDSHRLVLPTLTPERFADGDTLFGWTLAALQDEPRLHTEAAAAVSVKTRDSPRTLRQSIDLLRRQEALAASAAKVRPASEAATPDSLAIQLAAVTSSGVGLAHGWWEFIDALASPPDADSESPTTGIRQVIVMLDDADRSPSALPRLLADLRWLTIHPAVVVILCASESTLFEVLTHSPEIGMLSASLRQRHATDTLIKALPRHLRHQLRALDTSERLSYHSLDSDGELRTVLAEIELPEPKPIGLRTLLDYFELSLFGEPSLSSYVEILPGNARRLDQVHRGLRAVLARGGENVAGEAAAMLTEAALSAARAESHVVPEDVVIFTTREDQPGILVDVREIHGGRRIGTGVRVWMSDTRTVGLRRLRDVSTYVKGEGDDSVFLPTTFTYALEFIKELSEPEYIPTPAFRWLGMEGEVTKPGGRNWTGLLEVYVEREQTDDMFLLIPDWENLVDYLLYINAWNTMIDSLEKAHLTSVSRDPTAVAWVTFTHIALVAEIHKARRVPVWLRPGIQADGHPPWANWSVDATQEKLRELLQELWVTPRSVRDVNFHTWLEEYYPWAADPSFAPGELGARIMELRAQIITDEEDRKDADQRCAARLYSRLQRSIGSRWIGETISFLATLDHDLGREIKTMHEISRRDRNRSVQGLLDALQRTGVPEELVRRLALHGLTDETARGLQELGLPRQVIAQLAEQLPPTAVAESDDPDSTDLK
jgi:hypothetical protein